MPCVVLGGPTMLAVGTDGGEWRSLDRDALAPLPPTGPFSAAVVEGDSIALSRWEASVLRLRDGAWAEITLQSPVLALAMTPRGLVAGDAAGAVSMVPATSGATVRALEVSAPVVELRAAGSMLAALGADGSLSVTTWPGDEDASFARVDVEPIGRAHALFDGPRGTIAVAGRDGLGLVDRGGRGRLARVTRELGDAIRLAVPFGDGDLCAVGDDGAAWLLDDGLDIVAKVRVPDGARVVGVAAAGSGLVAWTSAGNLFAVGRDARVERLPGHDIALAAEVAEGYLALRWTAAAGATVLRGRLPWS